LFNNEGAEYVDRTSIYFGNLLNIFDENGDRVNEQIVADIEGASAMLIYNNAATQTGTLNLVGFFLENPDESTTIAGYKANPVFTGNIIEFNLEPTVTVIRAGNTNADLTKMMNYIQHLTEGGKTYVYKYNDQFYELHNPCSGWTFVFQALDF
jgi:hypothetical protein